MSGYSSDEIIRMQQDAVRRAQDMQKRARGGSGAGRSSPPPPRQKPSHSDPPPRPGGKTPPRRSGHNLLNLLNFQNLEMDSDTILILLVFFILASDEGDIYTLMALLYLLI